jgi:formylglycine-generating enzyme
VARVRLSRSIAFAFASALVVVIAAPLAETDAAAGPANGLEEEPDAARASIADAAPTWSGPCAPDMVEVVGTYCPDLDQRCVRWLSLEAGGVERCAEFVPSGPCKTPATKKHFCIDKYEYPNKHGEKPVVMKTWTDAQEVCRGSGKRLCGDSEWTLACEGSRRLPYPYGRKRDARACNIDKSLPHVDEKAIADPKRSAAEVARLWQGEASGSRAGCVSAFGVFDMTGNVDEWVVNESGKPFKSGSKGGYWGPVRARCRPMTTAHGETFPFYQTGFRCCADVHGVTHDH